MSELADLIRDQQRDMLTGDRVLNGTVSLDAFPDLTEFRRKVLAHDDRHGTLYLYVKQRCRCAKCRAASAAYARARRKRLRETT